MNQDAIRKIALYGRFRIPFPDTSYALRDRRLAAATSNANAPGGSANASKLAADSLGAADSRSTSTLITRADLPDVPDLPHLPVAPIADRRSLRCFVTAHVVASIENLCASELVAHINSAVESVVGSEVLLKHNHAAAVGSMVAVTGCVSIVEGRSVTFEVKAKVDGLAVAEGQLRFVIVERNRFAARRIESIAERGLSMILGLNRHAPDVSEPHPVSGRSDAQFAAELRSRIAVV